MSEEIEEVAYITDSEFFNRFRPEVGEDRTWPVQRHFPRHSELIDTAARENRIWSVMCRDGDFVIASGRHHVNFLYYVITEAPWDRDYEVVDDDPDDHYLEALDLLGRVRATLDTFRPEFEANQARFGDILDDLDEIEKLQQQHAHTHRS